MRSLNLLGVMGVCVAMAVACGETGAPDDVATPTPAGTTSAPPPNDTPPPGTTAPAPTTPTPTPTPDAPKTASKCFADLSGATTGPDYDKFKPAITKSCAGTAHQKITGVEKLVFLGDSVTAGTPPTLPNEIYRTRVTEGVKARFGAGVEVADCSKWGARTDDYIEGGNQVSQCFPNATEPKKTLIVMTMGGNDIAAWAKDKLSTADAKVQADLAADKLKAAIDALKAPGRFPKGVDIVFANIYEYTDTSGDLASCPASSLAGMSGSWSQGAPAIVHFLERYMQIATQTKTDMIFLLETFCGHGYKRNDSSLQCYRGPGAELWFDLTCIHPTPKGHEQISKLFLSVIDGK